MSCVAAAPPGLRVELEGSFGTVAGDETLVRRAFANLLQNAVRYTPSGGQAGEL